MRQLLYHKMRQVFCYKMQNLLENSTVLLENAIVATKCDVITKCVGTCLAKS